MKKILNFFTFLMIVLLIVNFSLFSNVTQVVAETSSFQINASRGDVNQTGSTLKTNGTTIWIGSSGASSYSGLRFTNVSILPGAVITSAFLELRSSQTQTVSLSYEIAADDTGNSAVFSNQSRPSQRILTTARVVHNSNVKWLTNTWYQTEDISAIVQEVVNRADWQSGNSLSIIFARLIFNNSEEICHQL